MSVVFFYIFPILKSKKILLPENLFYYGTGFLKRYLHLMRILSIITLQPIFTNTYMKLSQLALQ